MTTGRSEVLTAEALAALETAAMKVDHLGVRSVDDALVMADAIVEPEGGDVEWLMAHGCDVIDHLRREVRRLTAALDGARREERERAIDDCADALRPSHVVDPALALMRCRNAIYGLRALPDTAP